MAVGQAFRSRQVIISTSFGRKPCGRIEFKMAEENEKPGGQQIQSVPIAFAAEELSVCGKCGRDNAPNRPTCIYCGAELAIREEFISQAKVAANDLAPDELGWNIIAKAKDVARSGSARDLDSLGFPSDELSNLSTSNALIPIARFASQQAAELAKKRLEGFATAIVSDALFEIEKLAVRISKVEFDDGVVSFTDFNRGTRTSRPLSEISAVVLGTLRTGRTTTFEKRGMRKKSTITDETSDSRDSQILEIYVKGSIAPFAAHSTGFDFSVLGSERSLLAAENFERLAAKFRELAPMAKVVTDHDELKNFLSGPWPESSRTDGLGRVQTGIGQRRYGRTATTDNTLQFAKFSRLQALDIDELQR